MRLSFASLCNLDIPVDLLRCWQPLPTHTCTCTMIRGQLCAWSEQKAHCPVMHLCIYTVGTVMGMVTMANNNCDACRPYHVFKAYWSLFFTKFNEFVVLTRCSGAYILRSDNYLWRTTVTMTTMMTEPITLPLAHACGVIMCHSMLHDIVHQ